MNESSREVLGALADCMPDKAVRVVSNGGQDRLWLPRPVGADYTIYADTDEGEGGVLIGALPTDAPEFTFFWHLPLESTLGDARGSLAVLVAELRRLVQHRSRIIQTAGLLLWRFRCEVDEDGVWQRVGGTIACTRIFFMPPFAFTLRRLEYHSGAPQFAV